MPKTALIVGLLGVVWVGVAGGQTCAVRTPSTVLKLVREICEPMGLRSALVMAVIQVESSGNPHAINIAAGRGYRVVPQSASEAQALVDQLIKLTPDVGIGLMQVHYRYHRKRYPVTPADLLDPRTNITIGCDMLRQALRQPGGLAQRIGRYNARSRGKRLVYAQKVLAALNRMHHQEDF